MQKADLFSGGGPTFSGGHVIHVALMKKLTRDIRNCNFQKKFEGEARPIGPNVKDFSLN